MRVFLCRGNALLNAEEGVRPLTALLQVQQPAAQNLFEHMLGNWFLVKDCQGQYFATGISSDDQDSCLSSVCTCSCFLPELLPGKCPLETPKHLVFMSGCCLDAAELLRTFLAIGCL